MKEGVELPRETREFIADTSVKTFEQDLTSVDLAIVDFWASWCGPCKKMTEMINAVGMELASANGSGSKVRVGFFKVDVDENPELVQRFQIMSLPQVLGFSGVLPLDRFTGRTKEDLLRWVERLRERIEEKHGEKTSD